MYSTEFPLDHPPNSHQMQSHHYITHVIETRGQPVRTRARHLPPNRYKLAKDEFNHMLQLRIIRPSSSSWSAALHMVPKSNGDWRPCGDYCPLNAMTALNRYPIPNLPDLSSKLHGSRVVSKIDLVRAYYQIPVHPDDIPKTAVMTPFGFSEFLRMPFGLRNAA